MIARLHEDDAPAAVVLGFAPVDTLQYGRVIAEDGRIVKMVEHKDATEEERQCRLCNSGLMAAREAEGHVLDNRLVRIEKAQIVDASVNGRIAEVSLRFEADIAAVTRDKDGNVVAGSLTDAVGTNDIWTFTRDIRSADPNWKLSETDEAA